MDQQPNNQQPSNQTPKQQVIEALKSAANVLVTVSNNPSVDQLAACIGLTLMLNKLDKHATAVFSGQVPSTLEFLQPEKTIETNTDSLRDFIISLDRSKADKLRYKVEDNVVKIFITPYRTSITGEDLQFSQGDFNVDVVIALGVDNRDHLDQAITSHGRILHDATVIGLSCGAGMSDVGAISWHEDGASSLSEMLVSISEAFQSGLLDGQMATSFLTGIVSETERFSNGKTTPKVMTMSAQLMAAGANQQLISTQLTPAPVWQPPAENAPQGDQQQPIQPYVPPAETVEAPSPPKEEFDVPKEGEQGEETSDVISLQEEETPPQTPEMAVLDSPAPAVEYGAGETTEEEKIDEIHIDENGQVHDAASDAFDVANQATASPAPENTPEKPTPTEHAHAEPMMTHEKVIQPLREPDNEKKTDLSSYIFEPPSSEAPNNGSYIGSTPAEQPKDNEENATGAPQTDIPMLSHSGSTLSGSNEPVGDPHAATIEPPIIPEGPTFAPSLVDSVDPSVVGGASQMSTPDTSSLVDPLAGMTPPVVADEPPHQAPLPPLPDIPPPSSDPASATPADASAARDAVMSAMDNSAPSIPSPIAALNATPISLDAPMQAAEPSAPTPPPLPPPMMMPPISGTGDTVLPPPPADTGVAEPTNPFNLPPVH